MMPNKERREQKQSPPSKYRNQSEIRSKFARRCARIKEEK